MKTVLLFLLLTGIVWCQYKTYNNPKLGISFAYSQTDYSPYEFNDSSIIYNLNSWNNFKSKCLDISFKYPPEVIVREDILDSFYGQSVNDSAIYIGYRDTLNNSKFCAVVIIYKSDKSFDEIAEDLYFEKDTTGSDSDWFILGLQSFKSKATYFLGKNCEGLRGRTLIKYDRATDYVFRTVLVFNNHPKLVLFFDSAGAVDCYDPQRTSDNTLWEDKFFNIAETIKYNK